MNSKLSKMKYTKKFWNSLHIHNSHNIASAGLRFFISFSPQVTGRGYHSAKYQVIKIGSKTDYNSHWTDNGHKTFIIGFEYTKEQALWAAMTWAKMKFGYADWEKDVFGCYHPKGSMQMAAENKTYCAYCGEYSHIMTNCERKKHEQTYKGE